MKKISIGFLVLTCFLASCKKELDINQNPNQPTAVTPNVVLSSALVGTGFNNARDFLGLTRWMGYWSRSGNYTPDVQTETYNMTNDYTDGEWANLYSNLNNYDYIETQAKTNGLPFYIGVAKTMKAYEFSILVDLYNNVPYSQAFDVNGKIKPVYDDGLAIYTDLIAQLDSAVYYFEQAKTYYSTAPDVTVSTDNQYDIVFGGSRSAGSSDYTTRMELWQRLANTIKLRLLLNESNVADQGFINAELAKDSSFGYLGANQSASVNPGYQASTGKFNPQYSLFFTLTASTSQLNYYRANTYAVDFYSATGDIRQYCFYSATYPAAIGSNYDGDPASVSNSGTTAVAPSGVIKDFTADQLIMSDFESLFLQAEAKQRGWDIDGNAQELYESAIIQNYVYLYQNWAPYSGTLTPVEDAEAYLSDDLLGATNPEYVVWDDADDKLQLILTQKWASLNGIDWVAAYNDYRRTGFPTTDFLDISHSGTHLQPVIPVRYLYPQSEYDTNGSSIPSLSGPYQFSANVFWDK